ncbi:MAG TPA: hypothetical protein VIV60_24025 [Polyangiaceae bacterium]
MSKAHETSMLEQDPGLKLGTAGDSLARTLWIVGGAALALSALLGLREQDAGRHFFHSYLVAYTWTLSIGIGALWWVTLQHLVNAKWSIVVRRIGEIIAANMWLLAVAALPLVVPVAMGKAELFRWVSPEFMHSNHALHSKAAYLNVGFFLVRFAIYFGFWGLWSQKLLAKSRSQDEGKGERFVERFRSLSAPSMILLALTLTFCSFDLLMSLDPSWQSTIFGVYYFAGAVIAIHATFIIVLAWLQKHGRMQEVVTVEHFHDLGKMLFAFVVFWAYIAFSQFMLIWYANVPEETTFYLERIGGSWMAVSVWLIVGHFGIPFLGLLSRHVKRNRRALVFWAVWMLIAHYIDLYWLVMPNFESHAVPFSLLDIFCWVGLGATFLAAAIRRARVGHLIPMRDPRLPHSLGFENT